MEESIGLIFGSLALIADVADSLGDLLASCYSDVGWLTYVGPDKNHPRGHERLEPLTAFLVGINHVALEVGDIEAAFYGSIFAFGLRRRTETGAFLDMGDQFLALSETPESVASVKTSSTPHIRVMTTVLLR